VANTGGFGETALPARVTRPAATTPAFLKFLPLKLSYCRLRSVGIFLGFGILGFGICAAADAPAPSPAPEATQAPAPAPAQIVTITGRVLDADSNLYLKNAEVRLAGTNNIVYTEDGGAYRIEVPAGSVTLIVSYANLQTATRTLDARPGAPNAADFELQPLLLDRRAAAAITSGTGAAGRPAAIDPDIIQLERFTVREERVGQAKVLMEQRAAENVKTIISTDQFGELTQGSVGEFMKYMPGITLDYDEDEATTVRVGGLDPKYAGFSMDGVTLASATEGGSRANTFAQMSITAIESIEFNQTLLARMPANTPAGKFELKTRYAFNRKKPEISFDFGADGTGDTIELGRAYLPDNKKHMRTYPGGRISYGGAFLNRRLGIEASVSRYQNYRNNQWHETQYAYRINGTKEDGTPINPGINWVERNGNIEDARGPVIHRLSWRDGPKIWSQESANLSVDYKITPFLTFSLRNSFTYSENEYYNIYIRLLAEEHDTKAENYIGPPRGSTSFGLTRWEVTPDNPVSLNYDIYESNSYRVVKNTNYLVSPRLNYKKGPLEINFRGAYSYSHVKHSDGDEGRFRGVPVRIPGVGWTATRPSDDSPEWTITQTAGTHWTEPQNWGRPSTYLMGVYYDDPHFTKNVQTSGYLDLTYAMRVLGHPVTFRAGGGILDSDYTRRRNQKNFNFIGPDGRQMATDVPMADNYVINIDLGGRGGNINQQNIPVVDQNALWSIYQEHPDWFLVDAVDNTRNAFTNRNNLTERIEALYAEATTRFGRFQFNLGVRGERTSTDILFTDMRSTQEVDLAKLAASPEEIATGKFDPTTVEGVKYQYYYGERTARSNSYDNLFLSGGLKYDITSSLRFQLSMSQAILRPDYDNLSGAIQYPDYYPTSLNIPNPKLKPEKTTKYYAGLQWYLNPTGIVELSAYRLDIDGLQIKNMQITTEQAIAQIGYDPYERLAAELGGGEVLDPETQEIITLAPVNNPIIYRSTINAEGTRTVYGVTLRYDQQLTFLPGVLKGLALFGSFTTASLKNAEIDEEKIGRASKSANGGIKYRLGRFNVQLRGTWDDDALVSVTRPYPDRRWLLDDHRYRKSRFYVDLSGGLRLNKNLEMVFSIRNLTGEPTIYYSNVPGRLQQYIVPSTVWNVSIKGKY
jgi:TonB-dependent receptor